MKEGLFVEKKSLRLITGQNPDWRDLAKTCVCFANSRGGTILCGIENKESQPPLGQIVAGDLPFEIERRVGENSVNVGLTATKKTAENGSEFIEIVVRPSISTIASSSDGRYYYRSHDECIPLLPDELSRLLNDKPAFAWELHKTNVSSAQYDLAKLERFVLEIRSSDRVSHHVKQKTNDELLEYYHFADSGCLTNLGVLWIGTRNDRSKLSYSPTIQYFKYDEQGTKTSRIGWHDHSLNPQELIEAIWKEIPDWREGVEISDGLFRRFIPHYEEPVVRELLANALVHRPYTTRGDVFVNVFPDRLEVVNPGLFPIGITAKNILHKDDRRNQKLAQVFYDLRLMDREGSGIDKMFEVLLSNGKPIPVAEQRDDSVSFTVYRRITKPEIVAFIQRANEEFQLKQKEMIALGLIAQHNSLSALELAASLMLETNQDAIRTWLGRLLDLEILSSRGKTKGKQYFVKEDFLRKTNFMGRTTLKRIEPHRLEELILQDVNLYSPTAVREIHQRIGLEIPKKQVQKTVYKLRDEGKLVAEGSKQHQKYSCAPKQFK